MKAFISIVISSLFAGLTVPTAAAQHHTLDFSKPKVSIDSLRFVYSAKGRIAIDLSTSYSMGEEQLPEQAYEQIDHSAPNYLMPDETRAISLFLTESIGDNYAILVLSQSKSVETKLERFARRPTGDGRFHGLWGVLDIPPIEGIDEQGNWGRPIGLAVQTAKSWRFDKKPFAPADVADLDSIRPRIQSTLNVESNSIVSIEPLYIRYPNVTGFCVIAKDEKGDSYLHVLQLNPSLLIPLKFHFDETPPSPRLLFEEPGGETDVSLLGSKLYVLPDLDGDQLAEVLIISRVSSLYAIEPFYPEGFSLQHQMSAYMGP